MLMLVSAFPGETGSLKGGLEAVHLCSKVHRVALSPICKVRGEKKYRQGQLEKCSAHSRTLVYVVECPIFVQTEIRPKILHLSILKRQTARILAGGLRPSRY